MLAHPHMTPGLQAEFQGSVWSLCTDASLLGQLSHTTRMRLVCFFKCHKRCVIHSIFSDFLPSAFTQCFKLCTHHIQSHLSDKNLANWAACMQKRVHYVAWDQHKTMCLVRGKSKVHEWQICVPPAFEFIYAVLHCHMLCIYVGRTSLALIQRLRKHITTALAHAEDSRFHQLLRTTDLADWMIVPLEIVWDDWSAALAERYWWDKFRRWCVNDMPPGVPRTHEKPSKLIPKKATELLRSLAVARTDRDFPRINALKKQIAAVSAELQLPLLIPAVVKVPYLTGDQKIAVSRVVNNMLRKVHCNSRERQAMRGRIRIVRTVPHSVRRCFEFHANRAEIASEEPDCFCSDAYTHIWQQGGDLSVRDGHFCLLPVSLSFKGQPLGSKDPLPLSGASCRDSTIGDLQQLARLLNVPMPNLEHLLPAALFSSSDDMLQHVQHVASQLNKVAVVRIVDKCPGAMWAFCRKWLWEQTRSFLITENYTVQDEDRSHVLLGLRELASGSGWVCSDRARLALLYLIGKGKSLHKPVITWRPICANCAPVVPRWRLRIAARAFTCFLRLLSKEVTGCFLHLSIQDVAGWLDDLNSWGCTVIGEADCKDQFNRILPRDVLQHLDDATQMFWSIHKYDKCLDRCGKANAYNFDVISHEELTGLIRFCLQEDRFCVAVGQCWSRAFALPMGGPFRAQAADLHSIWKFHLNKQRFYELGELSFTARGFPIWKNPNGRIVSLAQFRDNILVAAVGVGATWAMADVCRLLATAWSLRVLCPCITDTNQDCLRQCMGSTLYALGLAASRHGSCGTVCVHPSALDASWNLKHGAPLQSAWAVNETSLTNLFTGVLMNYRRFLSSWGDYLLSASAWLQVSLLCEHPKGVAVRACQHALHRLLSHTPHDVSLSKRWVTCIAHHMPCSDSHVRSCLRQWLQKYAVWHGNRYASWHIPHEDSHTDWCADWSIWAE